MTGSHIIVATPALPNGFSAPVVCLFVLFSFNYTQANRSSSLPYFDFFFPFVVSLPFFFTPPPLSPIITVFPICLSPSCFSLFPASISISPAWFSSNECSLRWRWPEVSWREAERLMRMATLLFARGVKREQMDEWRREQARAGRGRRTNWHGQ